jgi:hypothetical protein
LVILPSLASAAPLLVLAPDGVYPLAPGPDPAAVKPDAHEPLTRARALAVVNGAVVVVHDGKLSVKASGRWRALPGAFPDVRRLIAVGRRLCAISDAGELDEIDLTSGKRKRLGAWPSLRAAASDGSALYAAHDGIIETVGGARPPLPLKGAALAMAVADNKLYVATRQGPLWEIDLASGASRDLGLGGWWGTLALTSDGKKLFAVTQVGKVWEIDPIANTKTILAMGGWEGALAVVVAP